MFWTLRAHVIGDAIAGFTRAARPVAWALSKLVDHQILNLEP